MLSPYDKKKKHVISAIVIIIVVIITTILIIQTTKVGDTLTKSFTREQTTVIEPSVFESLPSNPLSGPPEITQTSRIIQGLLR